MGKYIIWIGEIVTPVQRNSFVCPTGSGGSSHLESVSEDDELFMDKQVRSYEAVPPGQRKHSLPQQLDSNGLRQVSRILLLFFLWLYPASHISWARPRPHINPLLVKVLSSFPIPFFMFTLDSWNWVTIGLYEMGHPLCQLLSHYSQYVMSLVVCDAFT